MSLAASFRISAPLLIIGAVSLVLFVVVLVDMLRRPDWQWKQAGSNKAMWLVLEIVLFVLFGPLAIVSGIVYLAAARPKLVAAERSGDRSSSQSPPWGSGYGGSGGYGTSWGGGYDTTSGPYAPPPYPGTGEPTHPAYPGAPAAEPPPPHVEAAPEGGEEGAIAGPSWHPDPSHRHEFRYWDGSRWTEYVSDGGKQSTDPPVA